MGIPVVLSRRAGVAEHLADAAVLVDDPADPAELRRALDEVRGDPARAAAAARRDVARRLTWSATSARGADVLERWAGSREVAAGHR
jgi:glycosyltransferase involved in cell wall biosynthesis